jgi:hypothetical protein
MNIALKIIIDKAIEYLEAPSARDAALDLIYTKLLILPIQRAWRSKQAWRSKHSKALI